MTSFVIGGMGDAGSIICRKLEDMGVAVVKVDLKLDNLCSWKSVNVVFPSPRSDGFYITFKEVAELVNSGKLIVGMVFRKGYYRDSEKALKNAMEDRLKHRVIKSFIYW